MDTVEEHYEAELMATTSVRSSVWPPRESGAKDGQAQEAPMKVIRRHAQPDDPMFGKLQVAAIRFYFLDEDDPIFAGGFSVSFPIQLKPSTDDGSASRSGRARPRDPATIDGSSASARLPCREKLFRRTRGAR
jgi:hypothetical protein